MASRTAKVFSLSLGKGLTAVVMLGTSMVLARVLNKYDFGTVRQTLLAYQFAAPLFMLGLPQAVFYFLPGEKHRPRGILIDNLTLLIISACIISLFLALGGNELLAIRFNNPELSKTLRWMIPYPLFVMPVALLGGVMVIRERVTAFAWYSVLSKAVLGFCIIGAAWWTKDYTGPLLAHILIPAIFVPVALWLAFSSVPGKWTLPDPTSMKNMLKFSVPIGLGGMLGTISRQLDKVIVSAMTSPEEFAVYANGAVEIPFIGIITGAVSAVVLVDMRKSVVEGNYQEAVRLFRLTAEKTSYVLFPAMVFLLISGDSFIQTLFSDKYADSVIPFRWYLLLLPVRTVVFGSLLMALNKTRVILIRSMVGLLVNGVLSVIFVSAFGPWGAVVATVITVYAWGVVYNLYTFNKLLSIPWYDFFPFKIWLRTFLFLMLPACILMGVSHFTKDLSSFFQLIIHAFVFGPFIIFWWEGKIYSKATIKKLLFKFIKR